jgi:hypothetical protein
MDAHEASRCLTNAGDWVVSKLGKSNGHFAQRAEHFAQHNSN